MKTLDLLSCPEATLTGELKQMKPKELERHSRKLLIKLGLTDYDAVMSSVIKAIAKLDTNTSNRFTALQDIIHSLLSGERKNTTEHNNLVERLALILMLIVAQKFHQIHASSK